MEKNTHLLNNMALLIKAARLKHQLSQEELAQKANLSGRTVSNLECGRVMPDLETLVRICSLLCVPINQVFDAPDLFPKNHSHNRRLLETYLLNILQDFSDEGLSALIQFLLKTTKTGARYGKNMHLFRS